MICLAAFLWSTSGFFAKAPVFDSWPQDSRGLLLAFWRAVFAALILILFVRSIAWSWKLVPMVLIFAVMNWTYLNSLVYCEATLAIWLQYTSPAWVFLLGMLIFKERPVRADWVLLLFVIAGTGTVLFPLLHGSSGNGLQYGILSGLFLAGVVLTLRWCREFDAAWIVFLNHAATAIVFLPFAINSGVQPTGGQWLYLAGFGMFQMGIPYMIFTRALQSVPSHEASGLLLLEPILVPVWVFVAWSSTPGYEAPSAPTLIGGALILAGLALRYFGKQNKPRRAESG